jgi:hypothetical protein
MGNGINLYLRRRATQKIAQGEIPSTQPLGSYARAGVGLLCHLCDATIPREDQEIAVELPGNCTLTFHVPCFIAWNMARQL